MFISLIEFATPQFDEAIALRDLVLRKPLGLEFHTRDISKEYTSFHLGLYSEDFLLLGVLTMQPIDDKLIKMRQVAIHPDHQSKGIGRQLVVASENLSSSLNFTTITLHARRAAVTFYRKMDYSKVGAEFTEVGIPHFEMIKNLES